MNKKHETTSVSEVEGHISQKYEIKKRLGKGAYGIVWKAVDRQTGEVVAVKKIFDAFRNRTDAQASISELGLFLQEFGDHPNIVKLLNVIRAHNDKDIYLIFEYMDTDLHAVIKKGTLLKDVHKRYVMYQLLKAIKYLHSGNVIHRDQKPSNVLLDTDCTVKLCDFGLARSLNQIQEDSGNPALTEYVATRWYRAPEILLGSTRYTKGVDMWSLGCILGEMLLGNALFPGTSTINQIEKIMSAIPHPTPEDLIFIHLFLLTLFILNRPQVPLEDLLQPSVPIDALDLLKGLLVFNPDKRLTAEQALEHPYVAKFHNPAREPSLSYDVILPVDDDVRLSVVQYRNKLYEMMLEQRNNQGMLKLVHPKSEPKVDDSSNPNGKTDKDLGESSCNDTCENEAHKETEKANKNPKPGPMNESEAERTNKPLNPAVGKLTYNPITHAPRRSAPLNQTRTFSSHINQTQNNPLVRKEESVLSSGLCITSARLNQRPQVRDTQPPPRFSKKVFQNNCNIAAAGDPRAKLGSYSQAYGTINRTDLNNLLRISCNTHLI
uniref:Mitogen-activated protein kinase 15 n=1 Tax=Periophthalmus magnuspinnatus TaxID=409849 RepID=A0A3B3ZBE8_9GOBI